MVALRSPYLLSNARLREAAAGGKPLGEGERSPAVAQMQAALLDLGYGPGGTAPGQVMDGTFGTGTAELVKAFQRDKGLASTGVLDTGTLVAADQALAVKTPMTPSHQSRVGRTAITPSAQSAGRNTPPIGPSTPRPLPYEDEYYMIGTEDPFAISDPGAGAWNSKPKTYSAIAMVSSIKLALLQGSALGIGFEAVQHLRHYFFNTGLDYRINLEGMIRNVPSAQSLFTDVWHLAAAFVGDLPVGRYDFTMRRRQEGYNGKAENLNWYLAIGGYSSWGKGRVHVEQFGGQRRYDLDLEYRFFDRYNWDKDKSVDLGPVTINDEFMGEFHKQGLAKEFNCWGSLKRRFAWTGSRRPSRDFIVHQGGR